MPSWFNNEPKMTRCEGHECVQVSFVVLLAPGIEAGNGDGGKEGSTAMGNLDCRSVSSLPAMSKIYLIDQSIRQVPAQ